MSDRLGRDAIAASVATYPLNGTHLGLIRRPTTLGVGTMTVAILGVGVFDVYQCITGTRLVLFLEVLADGGVQAGDVFFEEGTEGLAGEIEGHFYQAFGGGFFLALAAALTVVSRWRMGSGLVGRDRDCRRRSRGGRVGGRHKFREGDGR